MKAEQLLQHFERISEAPDAIQRLRRFILDLAVRGMLVEQDPSDEPASELLKRIATEKVRLVKAGEIKKQKPLPPLTSDELFNGLPSGWAVARLEGISVCLDYKREPINGSERQKRIEGKPQGCLFPYFGATQQQGWIDDYLFDEDLVLLGEDGVPFFDPLRSKAYLISGKTWVNNHAHVFKCILVSHSYLVHYLNVFDYSGRVVGATRSKLNQARAVDIPIPLPPLAEQHRIAAKVEELMFLCDQLDAAKAEREKCRDSLVAASLQRLNQPAEKEETFREHARFTFNNLPRITTRTVHIKQLRQTILNLAVRGKLVEQKPSDEPAINFLNRIVAEKVRPRTITKEIKGNVFLAPEETPFSMPASWEWACFTDYALDISTGPFGSALHQSDYVLNGIPLVNPSHMIKDKICPDPKVSVSNKTAERLESYRMKEGDIVMARRGEVGRAALVTKKEVGWLCGTGSFFVSFTKEVHRDHILLLLRSELVRSYLSGKAIGTTMTNLNHGILKKMPLPIPPLAEQHRIVAKVDELMAICDQLEAQITATEQDSRRFLESVLADALAPGIDLSAEAKVA